jgi:hypothetical protein
VGIRQLLGDRLMAITLSFDGGNFMQVNGKCYEKQNTLTVGTPDFPGAESIFADCEQCLGVVDPPPNNSTISTTLCGTTFNATSAYRNSVNQTMAARRVNGVRVNGTVPDILIRVTSLPGTVGTIDWCDRSWNLPADSGVTYRVCPKRAILREWTPGNLTTVNPIDITTGLRTISVGQHFLWWGDATQGTSMRWEKKFTPAGSPPPRTSWYMELNPVEAAGFGAYSEHEGMWAPGKNNFTGPVGGPDVTTTAFNSNRAFIGFDNLGGGFKRKWKNNLITLQDQLIPQFVPRQNSQIILSNKGVTLSTTWINHSTQIKAREGIIFEWFEGNNWAGWNTLP